MRLKDVLPRNMTSAYTILKQGDLVGMPRDGQLLYAGMPDTIGIILGRLPGGSKELNEEWIVLVDGKIQIIGKWRIQEVLS